MSQAKKKAVLKEVEAIANNLAKKPAKGKKKKGKKSGWAKALKFAQNAAPVAIPLALSLLGKGSEGSRNLGAMSSVMPAGMAIGLNNGIASPLSSPGIMSQVEKRDAYGKVFSTTVTGREELGQVTIPGAAVPGDVVFNVDLAPLSGLLSGTRLALLAAGFARFRVLSCSMSVVSSLAATVGGQLTMAILTDPQQTVLPTGGGPATIRLISDSAGSDVFQVWSNGICGYPGSVNVDPFYTNPLSTGAEYLTSAGQGIIVTMLAGSGSDLSVGTAFLDYEIELLQPTLESFATIAKYAEIAGGTGAASCTDALPFGSAIPPIMSTDNIGITGLTGAGWIMPAGHWVVSWVMVSTTVFASGATAFAAALTANTAILDYTLYMAENGGTSASNVMWLRLNIASTTFVSFATAYTAITGDTITGNLVQVFTDPANFPSMSSQRRLKALNDLTAQDCRSRLALQREAELDERLKRLEGSGSSFPSAPYVGNPLTSLRR